MAEEPKVKFRVHIPAQDQVYEYDEWEWDLAVTTDEIDFLIDTDVSDMEIDMQYFLGDKEVFPYGGAPPVED
jgi:hypothetical protein